MRYLLIVFATMLPIMPTQATSFPWQDIQARNNQLHHPDGLQHYRQLTLDEDVLLQELQQAPPALPTGAQARAATTRIDMPLPDGGFAEVVVTPTEILAPEVAAEHPDIHTWKVTGADGKVMTGVIDMTPAGFHAMLDMADGDTVFIDPQDNGATRHYVSFSKRSNRPAFQQQDWSCPVHGNVRAFRSPITLETRHSPTALRPPVAARAGETLHTYRIAIAATAEYTRFHGGQEEAYNAIVTLVNRLNQVYERDLSLRLNLVSDTRIIYTNAFTDPYTNNAPNSLLTQNTANLNQALGSANYDIGHVLATDGGGLASVATVCGPYKAEGMTGISRPTGDAFIIDYVAHEIGHQLGATHTFNGNRGACTGANRERFTAYEPGSGSTIMAYTGLCEGDNLQTDSDSMMHSASIQQVTDYIHASSGGVSCATATTLNNNNPVANAGADHTIPAGTPFILTGSGTDTDGDTLSYSWEQVDTGTASHVNVDLGDNALIRVFPPVSTPVRTVPRLSDLTRNAQVVGEFLPATSRTMNFRLQVRDGRGGINHDDMQLTVHDTGNNFVVTAPVGTSLVNGAQQLVSWDVAGTTQPPISCNSVDIALTTNGGGSFTTLLTRTPNDGSATVNLPTNLGSRNHIRVKCSDSIFFALSATSPARANLSDSVSSAPNTGSLNNAGGGGSLPPEWLVLVGMYLLYRLRKEKPQ